MGHSYWSDAAYRARQQYRQATKQTAFTYDRQVRDTGVIEVHPAMDPYGVTRESRDSAEHPNSTAIAVIFDVTGSMGLVPRVMQTKLGALLRLLSERQYVSDPQLLFGAVGDAYCDAVPLQIGQFEAGLEMDDDLGKLYLEGGGGGQIHETYELALYFMARHTAIDCYERRGHKGYLFTIGDEQPYDVVRHRHIRDHLGDVTPDIAVRRLVADVQTRYQYFHIIPTNTANGQSQHVQACWRQLLGERVLLLDDEAAVCETIALAIGLCEGTITDLDLAGEDLVRAGYASTTAATATTALARYVDDGHPVRRTIRGLLPGIAGRTGGH